VDLPQAVSSAVAAGDVNADGLPDLVMASSGYLVVLFGEADATFRPPAKFLVPMASLPILADFDRDGRLDLAGALDRYGVMVALNLGPYPDPDGDGIPNDLDDCTDIDGDGLGDPGFPANTCPPDPCPRSVLNDADQDGLCGDIDNCPTAYNP